MRTFFSILVIIFISGCVGSNNIKLTPNLKLTSQSIHIETPPSSYETAWEAWYLNSIKNNIQLFRHIPNMMSENVNMSVFIPDARINTDFLLDKKRSDDLERTTALPPSEHNKKNMAERGVAYNKNYVDFIGGLKCVTDVESSNIALGIGNKKYYTVCGYYDTTGAKKRIDIFYNYTYTHGGTKYDSDSQSSSVTPEVIQRQFKQDIKAIFDSLVIHDMDRERMTKEGLLHDKKYEIQEW
jgi:hypothetical protein